jgi:hypothetical protein
MLFLSKLEELYKNPKICVRRSKIHRWGVFAIEDIKEREILEEAPYFVLTKEEIDNVPTCGVYSYWLEDTKSLVGMGFAGLYNHSFEANVDYQVDKISEVIRHYAKRDITKGEELLLNYGSENGCFKSNTDQGCLN